MKICDADYGSISVLITLRVMNLHHRSVMTTMTKPEVVYESRLAFSLRGCD